MCIEEVGLWVRRGCTECKVCLYARPRVTSLPTLMRSRDRWNWWLTTKLGLQQSAQMKFPHQLHPTSKNWLEKYSSSTVVLTEDPADFRPNFDPLWILAVGGNDAEPQHCWSPKKIQPQRNSLKHDWSVCPPCFCLRFSPSHDSACLPIPRSQGYPNLDSRYIRVIQTAKGSIVHIPKMRFSALWTNTNSWRLKHPSRICSVGVYSVSFPTFRGKIGQTIPHPPFVLRRR